MDDSIDLTKQQIIWAILRVGEDDPDTEQPRADTTQILNSLNKADVDVSKRTVKRHLNELADDSLISISERADGEYKGPIPTSLYILTSGGMDMAGNGGISQAVAEHPVAVDNPARFGDLQSLVSGLKGEVSRLQEKVSDLQAEIESTTDDPEMRSDVDENKKRANILRQTTDCNRTLIEALQERLTEVENEEFRREIDALLTLISKRNERNRNVFKYQQRKIQSLERDREEQDEEIQELRDTLSHVEMWLSEQFTGGIGKKKYEPKK